MVQQSNIRGVLLDIDGTLIASNEAQAHAWVEAMHEFGYDVPMEKVAPLIGMGGDKVLPTVLQVAKDSPIGEKISTRRKAIFLEKYLPTLKPLPGAWELLQHMRNQGLKLVVATSAEPDEMQKVLRQIHPQVEQIFEQQTTSKDARKSKPDSDIIQAAIERIQLDPAQLVMIGDTAYDIESAAKAHVATIAFRSGGWSDQDLKGAIAIYDGPEDLLRHFDSSPLAHGTTQKHAGM